MPCGPEELAWGPGWPRFHVIAGLAAKGTRQTGHPAIV